MKSHTGGVMSFGVGGLICKSSKQKLNTKSSTEAEVVGASDYLPNTLWVENVHGGPGHTRLVKIISNKTTRVPLGWKRMAVRPQDPGQDTLISDISGSRTG
jgi:hypothetical protein